MGGEPQKQAEAGVGAQLKGEKEAPCVFVRERGEGAKGGWGSGPLSNTNSRSASGQKLHLNQLREHQVTGRQLTAG